MAGFWQSIKGLLGFGKEEPRSAPPAPDLPTIPADENPWGVPLLDLRAFASGLTSTTQNEQCAINAVSYGNDDGLSFVGAQPPNPMTTPASLCYPINRCLADGALFIPRQMEQKWAIYYLAGKILFIRSWMREVYVTADVQVFADHAEITSVTGKFFETDTPEQTLEVLDFLMRSHVLNELCPAPLPDDMQEGPQLAALWCFSMYGNMAQIATSHPVKLAAPTAPLRTMSLLHIAVARDDVAEVDKHLAAGMPIDLLATDRLPPLQWAQSTEMIEALLERGSPVDVRSLEDATPLMTFAQTGDLQKVKLLIDRGADVNAKDGRGFATLHRAAEMGHVDIVKLLLEHGAEPDCRAMDHTPLSLATVQKHTEIIDLLNSRLNK
ncbi:ankyrin repeat domain-containing protein [Blastopirellula marina]|uniref:Uncharacterized protein n=1 Tax=Blastopirellula marina TaxID=124 RepID=A0A2S8GIJ6_9BACT|nr:ankyrin repeat domain-containing protein [Blastopirellula marina]PQO44151.1 hypothetical protein C5Y93_21690 [Blastopirellula marina]